MGNIVTRSTRHGSTPLLMIYELIKTLSDFFYATEGCLKNLSSVPFLLRTNFKLYTDPEFRGSTFYAKLFGEKVVLATRRLKDFSESGHRIPDADDDSLREIIVQGYRVMYRLDANGVLVLAVMHGSRDLSNPENQPWDGG